MKKLTSFVLTLALALPLGALPTIAFATTGAFVQIDTINGQVPAGHCIAGQMIFVVSGVTGTNGGPYSIDLGNGFSTTTKSNIVNGGSTAFSNVSITYTPSGAGNSIYINLYHGSASGNDSHIAVVNQCIAPVSTAVLTIKKNVVNNNGGTAIASNFTLHLINATSSVEVTSIGNSVHSPFAGSSDGVDFIVPAGAYNISENPATGYTMTGIAGGTCALTATSTGTVTVQSNKNYSCTMTNDDNVPVNQAPVATAQSLSVNEDTGLVGTVHATDDGLPSNTLTFATTTSPSHGTITAWNTSTGAFTYMPDANYNGTDSFSFKANDGLLDSGSATVSITVNPVNDAPVLSLSTTTIQTINELTVDTFTALATDVDGDVPTFSLAGAPAGATIDGATGIFTWIPTEAQGPGVYSFNVVVSDGHGGTDSKAVTITVNEVNVAPVAGDDSVSTHQNTAKTITLIGTDTDLPANTLTFTIVTPPNHGTLGTVSGNQVVYTPDANFASNDSFTYKVNDGTVDSNIATISIDVNDHAPVFNAISNQVVDELSPLNFTLSAIDPDADPLTFSLNTMPSGVSFSTSTGDFSWTPDETQGPGLYNFIATVSDGTLTDSQPFTVTVNEVNVAPVAGAQTVNTNEDTAVSGTLTATDSDIPANILSFATSTNPAHGTLSAFSTTTGSFTYTPDANYNGTDSFDFVANDGTVNSSAATISFTIAPVNDAPTIALIGSSTVNLLVNDTFIDPGATTTDAEDFPPPPVVITGSVATSTPGTYILTYTTTDSGNLSTSTTRTVIVNAKPVENTQSLCSDGIDNDGDGLIDLADPDCAVFIPAPVTPPSGGGGGGNGPVNFGFVNGNGGQVLGASTSKGEVLGESCSTFVNSYMGLGKKNNSAQVKKLQGFLNEYIGTNLPVTGFFGQMTFNAVKQFQLKESDEVLTPWAKLGLLKKGEATGYVYKTTSRRINLIKCAELNIPIPQLP